MSWDAPSPGLFRAIAQLGRGGAFLHHSEVVLDTLRPDNEGVIFAHFTLHSHQPRLGIGIVILAMVGEDHRRAGSRCRLSHALLRVDVLVPALGVGAEST